MARGKNLTTAEKYSIRAMLEDGMPIKKMATHLCRTEKFIKDFIDNNLQETAQVVEDTKEMISEETENKVLNNLCQSGMSEMDAIAAVNRLRKKMTEPNDNVEALAKYCLRDISAKQLMINQAHGRTKGVSVMTAAASSKTDDAKTRRTAGSGSKGAIWRQDGTID